MQLSSSRKNKLRAAETSGIIKILNSCEGYNFLIWLQNIFILMTFKICHQNNLTMINLSSARQGEPSHLSPS